MGLQGIRIGSALALAALLVACGNQAEPECTEGRECESNRCLAGVCVPLEDVSDVQDTGADAEETDVGEADVSDTAGPHDGGEDGDTDGPDSPTPDVVTPDGGDAAPDVPTDSSDPDGHDGDTDDDAVDGTDAPDVVEPGDTADGSPDGEIGPDTPPGWLTCDDRNCEAALRSCNDGGGVADATCGGCLPGASDIEGACVLVTALGEPCTTGAACGAGAWCPTDTTYRRCAPLPVVAGAGFPFQYVPSGTFTMGSPVAEVGRSDDGRETQQSVTLSQSFFLGRTEVTQAQWRAVMGTNPSGFSSCGDTCPVEQVTWWSALAFANALSEATGLAPCYTLPVTCTGTAAAGTLDCGFAIMPVVLATSIYACTGYRLPTEAEWEYAARAGTTTATYGGNLEGATNECSARQPSLAAIAWWCNNAGGVSSPVATRTPNTWGLYDMIGNVQEWIWDRFTASPPGGTDPRAEATGTGRIVRGGSWLFYASYQRAANRDSQVVSATWDDLGLRLARTVP